MVNQRSRKPGLKAPPRVQELAAGTRADGEDAVGEAGAAGTEDADAGEAAGEAAVREGDVEADVDGGEGEVGEVDVEGEADDAEADAAEAADDGDSVANDAADDGDSVANVAADDGDSVANVAADEGEAVANDVADDGEAVANVAADDGEAVDGGAREADDGVAVDAGAVNGDAEAAAGERPGGEDAGDAAAPVGEADPLADMLAEFDAPRPVAPGVQLSEEIPIDPEDDLRAVEGEASLRLVSILESLLFAAAKPLKVQDLRKVLAETSKHQVQLALKHLMAVTAERGVVLAQVAGGFQFRTHPDNAVWVQKMLQSKPARLSRTQIETLAIVAYRQPITRPEIDDVRGVDSGAVLKTLLERELIQIVGKKEEPGRPLLYGTTVRFLEFFNLRSLRDMPTLRDFRDLSEESKATLRARLGASEAEALGQGVLGLDLSAGPKDRVEGAGEDEGETEGEGDDEGAEATESGDEAEAGAVVELAAETVEVTDALEIAAGGEDAGDALATGAVEETDGFETSAGGEDARGEPATGAVEETDAAETSAGGEDDRGASEAGDEAVSESREAPEAGDEAGGGDGSEVDHEPGDVSEVEKDEPAGGDVSEADDQPAADEQREAGDASEVHDLPAADSLEVGDASAVESSEVESSEVGDASAVSDASPVDASEEAAEGGGPVVAEDHAEAPADSFAGAVPASEGEEGAAQGREIDDDVDGGAAAVGDEGDVAGPDGAGSEPDEPVEPDDER